MKEFIFKLVLPVCVILVLLASFGCSKEEPLVINFAFDDAKGISVGDRVRGDGIVVGSVVKPPESTRPGHVTVSVRLDNISPDKLAYITRDLSAVIKKDSMVAGEIYLDLVFPDKRGTTVATDTILAGRNSQGLDIPGIDLPDISKKHILGWVLDAFSVADYGKSGIVPYWIGWVCITILLITMVALAIDMLIRLPQGKTRERSSPVLLRRAWNIFVLCLIMKLVLFAVELLLVIKVLGVSDPTPWLVLPGSVAGLVVQELAFWVVVTFLIGLRFRFDLLMKVKDAT